MDLRIALALLPLLGCASTDPPPAEVRRDPDPSTAVGGTTPGDTIARTHLLLLGHQFTSARAQAQAVTVDDLVLGATIECAAQPLPNWPDHFTVVTAHDGGTRWACGEGEGRVVLGELGKPDTRTVTIPHTPAAMRFVASNLIVGAGPMVGSIATDVPNPTWTLARERREMMQGKAFDVLAGADDWLIAIDDVVMPILADTFQLDPQGRPSHLAGWDMPGVINGTYQHAVLVPTAARSGTLFAIATYSIMSGHGHDLAALPIRDATLALAEPVILNSSNGTSPAVLEEHVPRGEGELQLAAGTEYTEWTGLARRGDELLVAAGTRGLMIVPTEFTRTTKAELVDVGGPCLDVLVDDARIWVLVGGEKPAVVEYARASGSTRELRRTPLPREYAQIVD